MAQGSDEYMEDADDFGFLDVQRDEYIAWAKWWDGLTDEERVHERHLMDEHVEDRRRFPS